MENSFGTFLKQKRQEKKLTQKELAKLLFISESAVSKWEKDVSHPDITLLPKLAEILDVTEHELVTASIDKESREVKKQAKKWRVFTFSWSLFFYIAYSVTLIPCLICNLAIDKKLSWFWIVLTSLILAFTFTNLPKLIKKHKLLILPLSMYLALCLLLATCAIYTKGSWFFIASISVLLGLVIIFFPIYIAKFNIFAKIRKYNDFISIAVDFIVLNILFIIIDTYTFVNGYASFHWYLKYALPISACIFVILNLLIAVRFIKVNRLLKTCIILYLINILCYFIPPFIKVSDKSLQRELDDVNIFKADFSKWQVDVTLEQNVHTIIFLSILAIATTFLVVGLIRYFKRKK